MRWPVVPLGEVADTALGKMLDKGKQKGLPRVPYLRNINVQWGRIDVHDVLTMELAESERERFAVEPNDLLVCEGGEIGRCAVWRGGPGYISYQKALHRIRPGERLHATFLRYLLELHSINGTLARFSTGSTIAHLPQQQLRRLPVPLPPLDEQRLIVDLLEDHLSRLDAAEAYLSSAASKQEVLKEELLHSALAVVKAADVLFASVLVDGLTNGRSVPTRAGGFPVLRLTALRDGRIDLQERKDGAWGQSDAARFVVEKGDFLIARGNGSIRLVGLGGLVVDEPDPVAYPDTLIRARPDQKRLAPDFLSLVWNSRIVRKQIEAIARTTAGIYKINQKDLGAVVIPVPSLVDQAAVVAKVQKSREGLGRLASTEGRIRIQLAAMRRSLLAAAFAGQLSKAQGSTRNVVLT